MQRLLVLSLKNLALSVSKQEGRSTDAMKLFAEAIERNPSDVGLVDRFGSLAAKLGEWSTSKDAFMAILNRDQTHLTAQMKLMQVLKHLHDEATVVTAARVLEKHNNDPNLLQGLPNSMALDGCEIPDTMKNFTDVPTFRVSGWRELLRECCVAISSGKRGLIRIEYLGGHGQVKKVTTQNQGTNSDSLKKVTDKDISRNSNDPIESVQRNEMSKKGKQSSQEDVSQRSRYDSRNHRGVVCSIHGKQYLY